MSFRTRDLSVQQLDEGDFQSIGYRFTGVSSNGGGVGIRLVNNNSDDVFIPNITLRSSFRGRVVKGFNPSVASKGNSIGFTNKRSDGANGKPNFAAYRFGEGQGSDLTFEGNNFNDKHLAAGTATSPGTQAEIGGNILAAGDAVFVYAVNESSNAGDVSIDLDFIERE